MDNSLIWGRRPAFWAGVLVVATTAVRLAFIASGQLDLVQDEAQYWDWSRRLQASYFTKGPLIAWWIGLWTAVFGNTDFGVRFGAVLGSTVIQVFLYLGLARGFGRPRLALMALVVANATILFMVSGLLMTTDNPLLACWVGGLFCLHLAARGPASPWPLAGLAACMAVGVLAKYMMLALAGVALLYWLGLKRRGRAAPGLGGRLALALGLGAVLGLIPIIVWNAANDWVGLRHVFHLAGVEGKAASTCIRFDRVGPYLGSQLGLLTPWWMAFMLVGAWRCARQAWAWTGGEQAGTNLSPDQALLLACGFWPVWGFFLVWSLHTKILANWPAVSYASGLILAAVAWGGLMRRRGGRDWRVWLWPALGLLLFVAGHVHDLLPIPYRVRVEVPFVDDSVYFENPMLRLKGWQDLGREVDVLRRTRFADPDKVFFFAGNYDMTAALAYHVPGQPRAYCLNAGRRLNQYDLWPSPDQDGLLGWDAVYVRQKFHGVPEPGVPALFESVRRIQFQSEHEGRPARRFTIFLCRGYKGPWPGTDKGTGY